MFSFFVKFIGVVTFYHFMSFYFSFHAICINVLIFGFFFDIIIFITFMILYVSCFCGPNFSISSFCHLYHLHVLSPSCTRINIILISIHIKIFSIIFIAFGFCYVSNATCCREATANACPPSWNSDSYVYFNPLQCYLMMMMFADDAFSNLVALFCKTCPLHAPPGSPQTNMGFRSVWNGSGNCWRFWHVRWFTPWRREVALESSRILSSAARLISPLAFPAHVSPYTRRMNEWNEWLWLCASISSFFVPLSC